MNTKEAIEIITEEKYVSRNKRRAKYLDEIIKLLQRGEKYENMWREFENKDLTYKSDSPVINDEMYYIEQKYFPKGGS